MLSEPLFRLRLLGWIEGTTLLVLIGVAVPLKHLGGWPQGVSFMGPAHGFAFLVYLACVVETVASGGWTPVQAMRLVVVSLVPFGTFLNDRWLAARQVKSARHQRP
jgi:integral membrane protein